MSSTRIPKIILFNEDEEYYEFLTLEEAAKFLDVQEETLQTIGEEKINDYYVERESDTIVQYSFHTPVKVWTDLDLMCRALEMHPITVGRSLRSHGLSKIHFKWFAETKGKRYDV